MKAFVLFFFLEIISSNIEGQTFISREYSANDGLPSSYCFTALQDKGGYLWVGTYGGLGRFNGQKFQNYTVNNGLLTNQATSLFQDRENNIWVGTFSGMSILNNGKFTNYSKAGTENIERVFSIIQDFKGNIWATCRQGLLKFENSKTEPKLYNLDTKNEKIQKLWCVYQIPSGQILVSNSDKLFVFENEKFREIKDVKGKSIEARCIVKVDDKILIGTYGDGFLEYKNEKTLPMFKNILPDSLGVFDILKDKKQRILLATTKGTMVIDKGKLSYINSKNLSKGSRCFDLCEDKNGDIWISSPEGLTHCRDKFIDVFDKNSGLLNDEIYSFSKASDGSIYFGGSQNSLTAYRNHTFQNPFPRFVGTKFLQKGTQIHFIKFDAKGNLWVSCDVDSVYKINQKSIEKIKPIGKFCFSFMQDADNETIWIGGRSKFYRFSGNHWTDILLPPQMGIDDILSLHQDKQKRIWIGTLGLIIFDGKTWQNLSKITQTENVFISSIKRDSKGNIWLATIGKGIRKLTVDKNDNIITVENITTKEGLQNDSVLDIEFDNEGQLWVGSFGGIVRLNLLQTKVNGQYNVRLFNQNDGIIDNTWRNVCLLKDNAGDIWAGTSKGAMRFRVADMPANSLPPFVHISSVQILRSSNQATSTISPELSNNDDLPYNHNSVSFNLDGINFINSESIRYTYKLEGLSNASWSELTKQNQINFSNLPPNKYNFSAKALNSDNNESSEEVTFSFNIQPPFWQTWWFRFLMAFMLCYGIYAIIQIRIKFLNDKNKLALQMSEWKLKALQSQMNPHFIFNSLNSIQNFIISNKPLDGAKYLSKFSKLVRRILENSNHQQMKLEDIIETMRMYVELETLRFNQEFTYHFDIEDDDVLYETLLPPMLFQPFIENAIWHGLMPKEGEKNLLFQIKMQNNALFCVIEDNGIGRKTKEKEEGYTSRGEEITRNTFEALNQTLKKAAKLNIIDKLAPSTGTRVEITIPLN